MRYSGAAGIILALIASAWAPAPATANDSSAGLRAAVDRAISAFSGTAGVAVADPLHDSAYEHDARRIFPAASLYKLAVMVEAFRQQAAGTLSLDDTTVTIADEDLTDGEDTASGTRLSFRDAVERMITLSDNSCARALLRLLDAHSVNDTAAKLGLGDTRINTALPPDEQTADFNTTSVRDMERLFAGLVLGRVVSPRASEEMLAVLGRQQINDRLPAGLPEGTFIAHKTGNLDGIAHDAGVVMTPLGPRIVVLLTENYADYADVTALAAAVAQDAYALPLDLFAAVVSAQQVSPVAAGSPFAVTVNVSNSSTFTWGPGIDLGAHWRSAAGAYLLWDAGRADLPPLRPGESATVTLRGTAPPATGPLLVLELDVVREGVAWAGTPGRLIVPIAPR